MIFRGIKLLELLRVESLSHVVYFMSNLESILACNVKVLRVFTIVDQHVVDVKVTDVSSL
jgi:hypothetical protein